MDGTCSFRRIRGERSTGNKDLHTHVRNLLGRLSRQLKDDYFSGTAYYTSCGYIDRVTMNWRA